MDSVVELMQPLGISTGQSFWLHDREPHRWMNFFSRLPLEAQDIYFDVRYVSLYQSKSTQPQCFIYVQGDFIYFNPFLVRPVPDLEGYVDITTPYGYGGPVANTQDQNFLKEAYDCFVTEAVSRGVVAEVIKFHPLLNNQLLLKNCYQGRLLRMCSTVYMDVTIDPEYRWMKIYDRVNRQEINKARRRGITFAVVQSQKVWETFQQLYEANMRFIKAESFYLFSTEYYQHIQTKLSDGYQLVACFCEERIVSVLLVLLGKQFVHCHLIGTDREFVGHDVNKLLYHELALWSQSKGYKKVHIGGGRTNDEEDSLLKFKKNFSDQTADFYVGEHILNPTIYEDLSERWHKKNPNKKISDRLLKYRL